ncbi:hypothetical protein EVAR_37659_1 [Eumeta japonica]|uniref:Uncharacterized protein n=1 Tax=Eumeta variegata TaxID=151549 RepID=A0A4C1Z1T3_EUMVA|nr:hypothetical protein EVAR_37659_1 [Eumeta japonica]
MACKAEKDRDSVPYRALVTNALRQVANYVSCRVGLPFIARLGPDVSRLSVEINTSLYSTEPPRETLCPLALRDRFDGLCICIHYFLTVSVSRFP